jgi:hypothetical protein
MIPRLDLNGSYTGEIDARGITVDNDVEIGQGFHASGEVSVYGARIGGGLDARDGHFVRSKVEPQPSFALAQWKVALLASSAQIGGDVWFCCGFESLGAVFMQRAKIRRGVCVCRTFYQSPSDRPGLLTFRNRWRHLAHTSHRPV